MEWEQEKDQAQIEGRGWDYFKIFYSISVKYRAGLEKAFKQEQAEKLKLRLKMQLNMLRMLHDSRTPKAKDAQKLQAALDPTNCIKALPHILHGWHVEFGEDQPHLDQCMYQNWLERARSLRVEKHCQLRVHSTAAKGRTGTVSVQSYSYWLISKPRICTMKLTLKSVYI